MSIYPFFNNIFESRLLQRHQEVSVCRYRVKAMPVYLVAHPDIYSISLVCLRMDNE